MINRPFEYVGKMLNTDAVGLCGAEFCDEPCTHYIKHVMHGILVYTPLCEHHADIIDNAILESIRQDVISND